MTYAQTGCYAIGTKNITGAEDCDGLLIDERARRISGPGRWLMYFCVKDTRGRWDTIMTIGRRLTKGAYVLGKVVGTYHAI